MDLTDKNVNDYIPESTFHPSLFTEMKSNSTNRSLKLVESERDLSKINLSDLKSPGNFFLTPKDKYNVDHSNTNSLFKNLHGETLLTKLFFGDKNIQNIQNMIRYLVFKNTQKIIDNQSKNELMIIMRSTYLEYFKQPMVYSDDLSDAMKMKAIRLTNLEVSRLNKIVVDEILPKIVSGLQQYMDYLRDTTRPFGGNTLDNMPESTTITGQRDYRSITSVLFGGDF